MKVETFLDYNQILKIVFELTDESIDYDLICDTGDKRLSDTIIKNLNEITTIQETDDPDIYRLTVNETIFINISKSTGEIESINKLTAFETRLLAQSKSQSVPFERKENCEFVPKTDLHTHLAGAFSPDILINVGIEHGIGYPANLLSKLGIDISNYTIDENGKIQLSEINEKDMKTLKERLMISQVTQETFNKMEEVYDLRKPFTKNKALFPDLLKALAQDYKEKGIEYAELSFSAFLTDPDYMQMVEDNLPQIEQETGVQLRFLGGIWRHSDLEWNQDDADRLINIAKSPYIVGCDVMGHETNSTDSFKEVLQMLAQYAMKEDPNFAIRVHAGENPMFKDNVKKALEIIYAEHHALETETGTKQPMPRVRIGHGLYGVDEEVLDMAKEMEAIIEFNMSSNLALNNINDITEIPIKKYLDRGIDVVLGTDGHGLYSTSGSQEALLASAAGLEPSDFEKIKQTESKVMERARQRQETHPTIENVGALYDALTYSTSNGDVRYTPEVESQYQKEKQEASRRLGEKIAYTQAITDEQVIEQDTMGKIPIMLTGASKSNWPNILPEHQEYIKLAMQVLANTLNPETSYIVTGGTNFGVEKTMHEAVHRRNVREDDDLILLGTLTMEAANEGDKGVEKDTITHATILELDGRKANNWMELPDTQLEYVRERDGYMIAIGGGGVVNDMIQRAHNLGVDMHLMDGPYGASTKKSKSLSGNDYSFKTIEQLLQRLYERNPNMFSRDFSLENIEEYIQQAKLDLQPELEHDNPANFGLGAIAQVDEQVTWSDRENGKNKLQQELQQSRETEVKKEGESK